MKRTASHNDLTLSPLRFLIVDDSDLNRKVIVRQIESERKGRLSKTYIRQADDGLTALEVMREELQEGRHFDVVLMDYTMINMHGPDAATVMRKEFKFRGPIIGVTGNALAEDIATFLSSGASEVLTKPLTKVKLMNTLSLYCT
mmetsp:Transcript_18254/g.25061  ORF Transcript_18254/g.25061 Transcript_18254/m.25061 type:complete len:144 (-) Transcript_18254:231-662(-)